MFILIGTKKLFLNFENFSMLVMICGNIQDIEPAGTYTSETSCFVGDCIHESVCFFTSSIA